MHIPPPPLFECFRHPNASHCLKFHSHESPFSSNGARPLGGNAMLDRSRMTPGNRYTCAIFIDIDVIYSKLGRAIFSLPVVGCFAKNIWETLP